MLIDHYRAAIESGEFMSDPAQEQVVKILQEIYDESLKRRKFLFSKRYIRGLYLWGSVGAGKTWLVDMFYHQLPTQKKIRLHFHHFMREVHEKLKQLQGQSDPLKLVAKDFAKKAQIICFDEFMVSDITDAMLLGNLLEALFKEKVTIIATSNVQPDDLYRNGLQRDRFLPAIDLIKQHMQIFQIKAATDYRLRTLESAGVYFCPLDEKAEDAMMAYFRHLSNGEWQENKILNIENRPISTVRCAEDVVWFDFHILCHIPRSQRDYLEIARDFSTVFVSHVPQIKSEEDDVITYFIHLVDIFYDARVKLIISAAAPIEELYREGRFSFQFQRTCSRLQEMQSHTYLGQAHYAMITRI